MDLRSLNTFIHVAELCSFSRAAEKLGYSQPTISFQIKQLEAELGMKLFERIGHTVRLTDSGRDALAYAQQICQLSREMTLVAEERSRVAGLIRVALADSLCAPMIADSFDRFRAGYPNVRLQVTTAGTAEMFRQLNHNEADLVCTLDSHIYDANYIIAHEERVGAHFVAAADNPLAGQKNVSIEQIRDFPLMLTEKGMSYRRLLDEMLARDSIELQPVLEMGSAGLICQMVEQGLGISFLPDYVSQEAVRSGRLVQLDVPRYEAELWKQLLHHRDKWVSPQMQALIDHLSGIMLCADGAAAGAE